jgi:GNAT superfamily N-acetyltransferase
MRVIDSPAGLPADPILRWTAQGLSGRARAWSSEDGPAFAVAAPALALHDRLAVHGPVESLVPLVREVLAEVGPSYRLLGDRPLITAVAARLSGVERVADFGWMDLAGDGTGTAEATGLGRRRNGSADSSADDCKAAWLFPADEPDITELLSAASPSSYATPGAPGVERWAGTRDDAGRLTGVAALAWSAPDVGFLAGIAVRPGARGQGLGGAVSGFVLAHALDLHPTAALMVDDANHTAIALYRRLGLRYRPVSAAAAGN